VTYSEGDLVLVDIPDLFMPQGKIVFWGVVLRQNAETISVVVDDLKGVHYEGYEVGSVISIPPGFIKRHKPKKKPHLLKISVSGDVVDIRRMDGKKTRISAEIHGVDIEGQGYKKIVTFNHLGIVKEK
jgi:hypothetical protein